MMKQIAAISVAGLLLASCGTQPAVNSNESTMDTTTVNMNTNEETLDSMMIELDAAELEGLEMMNGNMNSAAGSATMTGSMMPSSDDADMLTY